VFRGDLVRWDDMGTIPFDALGAPGWKPVPAPDRSIGSAASAESRHAG
jgi:dihydroorotate dehydrogenase electron transfer subunit